MKYADLFEKGIFDDGEVEDDHEALSRIEVKENSDAQMWVGSPRELMEWLTKHPKARAIIGRWYCIIVSPVLDDIFELERSDPPFGLNSAVEHFSVGKEGEEEFAAEWHLC